MVSKRIVRAAFWLIIAIVSGVFSYWLDANFWIVLTVILFAILAYGVVSQLEDDTPGDFANPDRSNTPKYLIYYRFAMHVLVSAAVLLAIAAIVRHLM